MRLIDANKIRYHNEFSAMNGRYRGDSAWQSDIYALQEVNAIPVKFIRKYIEVWKSENAKKLEVPKEYSEALEQIIDIWNEEKDEWQG